MDFTTATADEICRELGSRLRTARLMQGLTQAELAARAGVARGAVVHLETSGGCTFSTLARTVQALGLEADLQQVFIRHAQSIAQMEQAEAIRLRQRAPRVSRQRRPS